LTILSIMLQPTTRKLTLAKETLRMTHAHKIIKHTEAIQIFIEAHIQGGSKQVSCCTMIDISKSRTTVLTLNIE